MNVLFLRQYSQVAATAAERSASVDWGKAEIVLVVRFTSNSPLIDIGTFARALNTNSGMRPMGIGVGYVSDVWVKV